MKGKFSDLVALSWYQGALWLYLLFPLVLLYSMVILIRRLLYRLGVFQVYRSSLPVVIVGNITVGGTGKSPLVSHLVQSLSDMGFKPGIVSRGYGSSIPKGEVREVLTHSLTSDVGDEPLMLRHQVSCPIFVSPSRKLAVKSLEETDCNIAVTDDGLQHYALDRDVEICVVDGTRKWGNGWLLPMGPLRESLSRLKNVDFLVINGTDKLKQTHCGRSFEMALNGKQLHSLNGENVCPLTTFKGGQVHAIAAIGNPERFFNTLEMQGLDIIRHAFNDHHAYTKSDLDFGKVLPIIMTEKDAVKCRHLHLKNAWYLPVTAQLSGDIAAEIVSSLKLKGWLNG